MRKQIAWLAAVAVAVISVVLIAPADAVGSHIYMFSAVPTGAEIGTPVAGTSVETGGSVLTAVATSPALTVMMVVVLGASLVLTTMIMRRQNVAS